MSRARSRRESKYTSYHRWFPFVFLLLLWVVVVWIKSAHVFLEDSYENNDYYFASIMTEGKSPYIDFFTDEMPVKFYIFSWLYGIVGFNITVFKLLPLIIVLLSSLFIFLSLSAVFKDRWAGLLGAGLYVLSFKVLLDATNPAAVQFAVFFVSLGAFLLLRFDSYFWSSVCFSLAFLARIDFFVPLVLLVIYGYWNSRKVGFRNVLYGAGVGFVLPFLACILLWGYAFVYPAVIYPFQLRFLAGQPLEDKLIALLKFHIPLLAGVVLYLVTKKNRAVSMLAIAGVLQFAVSLFIGIFLSSNILSSIPLIALSSGAGWMNLFNLLKKKDARPLLVLGLLFVCFILARVSLERTYDFRKYPDISSWADHIRLNSEPDEEIYGFSTLVPLLALKANRSVYQNWPNVRSDMFSSGIIEREAWLRQLYFDPPAFVVIQSPGLFDDDPDIYKFLKEKCSPEMSGWIDSGTKYYLFRCSSS